MLLFPGQLGLFTKKMQSNLIISAWMCTALPTLTTPEISEEILTYVFRKLHHSSSKVAVTTLM